LSPPGCVDVEFVPGVTVNVLALGALKIIIPEPPAAPIVLGPEAGLYPPPPPPLPVLTVPVPAAKAEGPPLPPSPPPPAPPVPTDLPGG
jgi:hypothetical protein